MVVEYVDLAFHVTAGREQDAQVGIVQVGMGFAVDKADGRAQSQHAWHAQSPFSDFERKAWPACGFVNCHHVPGPRGHTHRIMIAQVLADARQSNANGYPELLQQILRTNSRELQYLG